MIRTTTSWFSSDRSERKDSAIPAFSLIAGAWTSGTVGDDTEVFGTSLALGLNDELHVAYAHGQTVGDAYRVSLPALSGWILRLLRQQRVVDHANTGFVA